MLSDIAKRTWMLFHYYTHGLALSLSSSRFAAAVTMPRFQLSMPLRWLIILSGAGSPGKA